MTLSANSPRSAALCGCLEVCDRFKAVLQCIPSDAYSAANSGSESPGTHLRHALEHFHALLHGVEKGVIDYDARPRSGALENDAGAFAAALDEVRQSLEELSKVDIRRPLTVRQMASLNSAPIEMQSSLERELAFLSSHAIHHLAVLEQWCRRREIAIPEDLSLAFSTAAHRAGQS